MTRALLACVALVFSTAVPSLRAQVPAPAATVAQTPTGNADNGKRLFTEKSCYFCHGTEGQGGVLYPRIARVQRGLDNFVRYVRRPARMAAYSDTVVSDAELADIYAFLRALPAPKAVKDIPLLEQMRTKP